MKKLISAIALCAISVSMLASCAGGAASSVAAPASGSTSEATAPLSGSITLMASQNWIKDVDRELFKAFEEKTGVEVKVLLTPDNGYTTLLGTSLSGGSNAVDMFMHAAGNEIISAGLPEIALDLSQEPWAANYEDWATKANTVDGSLYGFSTWGVDYEGILYNKTLFDEKGWKVPTTWDDFLTLCDTIAKDGIVPFYEGLNGTWHAQSWFYALTPTILSENADIANHLNSGKDAKWSEVKAVTDGLEQIKALLSNSPKYYTNDGQSEDWFGSYPAMQNRECAMLLTYSAYPAELAANGATDTFGMFPVPLLDNTVGVSNGGGISKFINKNSQNVEACKALCAFLAEDENLEKYYGARTDLVTSAFKDVESVAATTATTDMLERSTATPEIMLMKNVLYWDPDIYKYMQGFATGGTTVEQFITGMDTYRATMFDTVAASAE